MRDLRFSICIPTYNGAPWIEETLRSIVSQSFQNYEIIISDDASTDNTIEIIRSLHDSSIRIFKNEKNLGCGKNLEVLRTIADGDILYLMGQDDILLKDALLKTRDAFLLDEEIGAVTRPYYWFDEDMNTPVRAVSPYNRSEDSVISVFDGKREVGKIFESIGQISGLAYKRRFMDLPFHEDIFPCHIYPFVSILKKHPVVFLKDYDVAVRIRSSQSRNLPSIYDKSPIQSWVEMFNDVFYEKEFQDIKKKCIKNLVTANYVGLVQIRNYAKYKYLLREIGVFVKYRWQNILSPKFWFFCIGTLVMPKAILIPLVDRYKNSINSRLLKDIKVDCGQMNGI